MRAGGGHTVGIIPTALMEREVADTGADELIVTDTMRQRKQQMDDRADAFITLPGGSAPWRNSSRRGPAAIWGCTTNR